jgi:hypothetical protein
MLQREDAKLFVKKECNVVIFGKYFILYKKFSKKRCHFKEHELSECKENCERLLECGHNCKNLCGNKCSDCKVIVTIKLPCDHSANVECKK